MKDDVVDRDECIPKWATPGPGLTLRQFRDRLNPRELREKSVSVGMFTSRVGYEIPVAELRGRSPAGVLRYLKVVPSTNTNVGRGFVPSSS